MPATQPTIADDDLPALAAPVRAIAASAGQAVMAFFRGGFDVREKPDATPVTDADQAAEDIILPALAALTPGVPIVSEESAAAGDVPDISGGMFWAVDPLDGTREFIAGTDGFSVNIGLIRDLAPVFGVIHGPAVGVTYWTSSRAAARSAGADGAEREIRSRAVPPEGATVITSRRHGNSRRLAAWLDSVPVAARVRTGSALKFGRLAEGAADLYPRFGPTSEWDTAAGHAVLAAAGGQVTTFDGAVLGYGKPGFLNPDFIARGRG